MNRSLTISELITLVDGQLVQDKLVDRPVLGIATLGEATESEASFFGNAKYINALRTTKACVVLVPKSHINQLKPILIAQKNAQLDENSKPESTVCSPFWVQVENPTLAFSKLIEFFAPPLPQYKPGIHSTAIIGNGVQLGKNVSIAPYVVIEDNVQIGANTTIGASTFIGCGSKVGEDCQFYSNISIREGTLIGNRVIIHSGVVIGSDGFGFETQNGKHVKIPQRGIVQIDDDVEIGANCTIDRARFGKTHIGNGTKIDNLVQVAHNVTVGAHCLLVAQVGIGGSSSLGDYVVLAGQAGVVGHVHIGDKTIVTAQSGISKDTAANSVVFGSPAMPLQNAKEMRAYVRRLPKLTEQVKQLSKELAEIKVSLPMTL